MENINIDEQIMKKKDELNALLTQKQQIKSQEETENIIKAGLKIRDLRTNRNFSQEKLAEKANVSSGTISRIERGVQEPSYSVLRNIIKTLKLTPEEICELFNC